MTSFYVPSILPCQLSSGLLFNCTVHSVLKPHSSPDPIPSTALRKEFRYYQEVFQPPIITLTRTFDSCLVEIRGGSSHFSDWKANEELEVMEQMWLWACHRCHCWHLSWTLVQTSSVKSGKRPGKDRASGNSTHCPHGQHTNLEGLAHQRVCSMSCL